VHAWEAIATSGPVCFCACTGYGDIKWWKALVACLGTDLTSYLDAFRPGLWDMVVRWSGFRTVPVVV